MAPVTSIPSALTQVPSAITASVFSLSSSAVARLPPRMQLLIAYIGSKLPKGWKAYMLPGILGYLLLVRSLRYRRETAMRKRHGFPDRASLKRMTTEDAQRIIKELAMWEFPQFLEMSLQFGLFKTYGVESISRLLLATRNLTDPIMSKKRYEDTGIILGEFLANPPNSVRATKAVARMNFLHSKYIAEGTISNADLLYTLSVFVLEPERFIRLYEWRPLNEMEFCSYGTFWKKIGENMGIQYEGYLSKNEWEDGLDWAQDLTQWAKSYEVVAFIPSPISHKPAITLIPMITYWVPGFGKAFTQECVTVLLGDRVREAFMLPEPGISAAAVTYSALRVRQLALRYLSLPRYIPLNRHGNEPDADGYNNIRFSYGNYPFYIKPTIWNRWGPTAWAVWLAGGKLPGDDPEEFKPRGFKFNELGPLTRFGQGDAEMEKDFKRMQAKGMGGCPF